LSRALEAGLVITIDYGGNARTLPSPAGTLVSYAQHRVTDPLAQPGEQDLTAHVPFDALQAWGGELGLTTLAELPQWRFLAVMGALDGLHGLDALRAKSLVAPGRMGEFRVLVQGKGLGAHAEVLRAKLLREPG
ncbi:MAG: SAM-dependent methyltransferase, partial [Halobacteriales archaeon]|nr:SAM-dependent methyltransferase [Halobacteriales archaeon]